MKKYIWGVFVLAVLAGAAVFVFEPPRSSGTAPQASTVPVLVSPIKEEIPPQPQVVIRGVEIPIEVVTSTAAIQKGLSGRKSLDQKSGMLFIFSKPDIYRFWMPDMHFSIDIIWLGPDKKIVGLSRNLKPEANMASPKFYRPPAPAQYVLEVNAGFAKTYNLEVGDQAVFQNM